MFHLFMFWRICNLPFPITSRNNSFNFQVALQITGWNCMDSPTLYCYSIFALELLPFCPSIHIFLIRFSKAEGTSFLSVSKASSLTPVTDTNSVQFQWIPPIEWPLCSFSISLLSQSITFHHRDSRQLTEPISLLEFPDAADEPSFCWWKDQGPLELQTITATRVGFYIPNKSSWHWGHIIVWSR